MLFVDLGGTRVNDLGPLLAATGLMRLQPSATASRASLDALKRARPELEIGTAESAYTED